MARTIEEAHQRQERIWDENARQFSNQLLGKVDVIDPETGRSFKVDYGSRYYWTSPLGTIVGSDLDVQPGLSFRRMVQLP
jgi:hypothetical protein